MKPARSEVPSFLRWRSFSSVSILVAAAGSTLAGCSTTDARRQPSGSVATAALPAPREQPAAAAPERTAGAVKLGAPIRSTNDVALASIARDATKYAQQTVRTEGRVTSVCQAMGCWMEITDSDSNAHIRMTGHSFFIPKDAIGRRAVLEGTVLAKPDDGECEQEAMQATGRPVKVEIDAVGVELL